MADAGADVNGVAGCAVEAAEDGAGASSSSSSQLKSSSLSVVPCEKLSVHETDFARLNAPWINALLRSSERST